MIGIFQDDLWHATYTTTASHRWKHLEYLETYDELERFDGQDQVEFPQR